MFRKITLSVAFLALGLSILACNPKESANSAAPSAPDTPTTAEAQAVPKTAAPKEADITKLLKPENLNATAPDEFKVKLETTKGDVIIAIHRDWAPKGADRFYNLVSNEFYTDIALFRVLKGFVAQFGIHGKPIVTSVWREATIDDDPVKESNTRGKLTFATGGPNTRTTQLFINTADNSNLDEMGFSPIGEVVEGMDIVDAFNNEYGEGAPRGRGPNQGLISQKGNEYLRDKFPNLDYIRSITIVQ